MSRDAPTPRNQRMAGLVQDLSVDELRRTTIQAIDHAHKASAEVAEALARFEGAMGLVSQLRDDNRYLDQQLASRQHELEAVLASRTWRLARGLGAPVRFARRITHR